MTRNFICPETKEPCSDGRCKKSVSCALYFVEHKVPDVNEPYLPKSNRQGSWYLSEARRGLQREQRESTEAKRLLISVLRSQGKLPRYNRMTSEQRAKVLNNSLQDPEFIAELHRRREWRK